MRTKASLKGRIACLFSLISLCIPSMSPGEESDARSLILGDAILEGQAYNFLEHISDHFGARMIGTNAHSQTLEYLENELQALGLETHRQSFSFPGWVRGESEVTMVSPEEKQIRAVALGYVGNFDPVEASVLFVSTKEISELDKESTHGNILLLRQNISFGYEEMVELTEDYGVVGLLYTNRVNGGQVLARTANHDGHAAPLPVFSITQEAGLMMQRMLEDDLPVRVRLENKAKMNEFKGTNLIATLPGNSGERIILGAHFDSWDLGQGAIDNGLGVAQVYDVARLLKLHSPENRHSIDFVWFDAEEFGLWGSRHYAEANDLSDVRAMINLDMVGQPIALNAMGFDGLVPVLEKHVDSLSSWSFEKPVANKPWLGSDHYPFILKGVPSITYNAPLEDQDVRYYHDFSDTFDKIDPQMLGNATALIALLVYDLANDSTDRVAQLDNAGIGDLFRKAKLEERVRKAGDWNFGEEPADQEN